ncbi:MAG: PP2C family protein-serine/threonine phosphatase [Nitrospirae bacterium]|nr:PP2C family protein-serine/threonine phosphatase [Nitrospirota bacterium]
MGTSVGMDAAIKDVKNYDATTPGKMTAALTGCIIGAVVMALCAFGAYSSTRQAVQTVGKDAVPSIVAAERIRATLSDAHANAMNAVVTNEGEDGPSLKKYRQDMDQVHADLFAAAQNITYGDEEKKPILALMTKLGEYERVLGRERVQSGDNAIATILASNSLMRGQILPAAIELDQANFRHLTATYDAHRKHALLAALPFIIFALVTLAVIIGTQISLFKKTRRILNPAMAAATAIALAFAVCGAFTLKSVETTLISLKKNSFDSIHALWKAKAIAHDANADESLYLIYNGRPAEQLKTFDSFKAKAAELVDLEPEEALAAVADKKRIKGLLGDELANITFPGEEEAAKETLRTWVEYKKIDGQITGLLRHGHYQEALKLNLGTDPGQSNWAFDRFDQALDKTLKINETAFQNSVDRAFKLLGFFPYMLGIVLVSIIVACILGEGGRLLDAFHSMRDSLKDYIRQLAETTAAKEKIESELKIASDIQMSILPRIFPPFPDRPEFDIFALIEPAKEVGGDFYDFFQVDDTHLCFTIADVSGKGVPAALYMAVTKTLIMSVAKEGITADRILMKVNDELSRDNDVNMFVTIFCGILDISTGEVCYANGGHNPPLVIRKDGDISFLGEAGGLVIGAFEGMTYTLEKLMLGPGDTLFMYTDGVTEAMNEKEELFSDERLERELASLNAVDIQRLVSGIMDKIIFFTGGAPQSDDITMLAVRFYGL